jgi:hypothetical protein
MVAVLMSAQGSRHPDALCKAPYSLDAVRPFSPAPWLAP